MNIIITEEALEQATLFADRYFPNEMNAIPVGYIILHKETNPLTTVVPSRNIRSICVVGMLETPHQVNKQGHTSISHDLVEDAEAIVDRKIEELRKVHIQIQRVGKLHTHPFERGHFMSSGDIYSNMQGEPFRRWASYCRADALLMLLLSIRSKGRVNRWRLGSWIATSDHPCREVGSLLVSKEYKEIRIGRRLSHQGAYPGFIDRIVSLLEEGGMTIKERVDMVRGWTCLQAEGLVPVYISIPPQPWRSPVEVHVLGKFFMKVHEVQLQQGKRQEEDLCQKILKWWSSSNP